MNRSTKTAFSFLIFFALFILALALQSSLFHWIVGGRVTIQVAILLMTYVFLYRKIYEALLFSLLAGYCFSYITTIDPAVSVFVAFCLCFGTQALKKQVYSSGIVHFTRIALGNVFFFHLIGYTTTMIFAVSPSQFRPLDWLLELLITALFTNWLYGFFIFIDKKTKRIEVNEFTGGLNT